MNFRERRHQERTTPDGLVYIDLKPDNGGIVLNVSDQGLCFQSVAPVKKHERLTFSFHERDLEGDGVGEVVWIDKTNKLGGLRFTQVRVDANPDVEETAEPVPANDQSDSALASQPSLAGDHPVVTTALLPLKVQESSPLHTALLREANPLPPIRSHKSWLVRLAVTALAIYALWASVTLHRYRGRPTTVTQAVSSSPEPAKPVLPLRSAPTLKANPSSVAVARPASDPLQHSNSGHTNSKPLFPEPNRPMMHAAPAKFDYPVLAGGTPSGKVDLKLLIGTTGSVESVKVLSGNPTLAKAATRAARGWRYRPLVLNGQAVISEAHVTMRFAGDEAVSINFRE